MKKYFIVFTDNKNYYQSETECYNQITAEDIETIRQQLAGDIFVKPSNLILFSVVQL